MAGSGEAERREEGASTRAAGFEEKRMTLGEWRRASQVRAEVEAEAEADADADAEAHTHG